MHLLSDKHTPWHCILFLVHSFKRKLLISEGNQFGERQQTSKAKQNKPLNLTKLVYSIFFFSGAGV
jgi:hypothetical protein